MRTAALVPEMSLCTRAERFNAAAVTRSLPAADIAG
jgi:hypothetical protein